MLNLTKKMQGPIGWVCYEGVTTLASAKISEGVAVTIIDVGL